MLICPRCSSAARVKSGASKGRQRFKCKECQYLYTVPHKSDTSTPAQRRLAVTLYLGFSHVAIYQWIKALGEEVAQIKRPSPRSSNSMNCIVMWGIKKLLLDLDCC